MFSAEERDSGITAPSPSPHGEAAAASHIREVVIEPGQRAPGLVGGEEQQSGIVRFVASRSVARRSGVS